jgi:hypothetical protein
MPGNISTHQFSSLSACVVREKFKTFFTVAFAQNKSCRRETISEKKKLLSDCIKICIFIFDFSPLLLIPRIYVKKIT